MILLFIISCGEDIDETTITRKITIQGEVINSSQKPLGDVNVTLYISHEKINETNSQADGKFEFSVDEDDFENAIIVQAQKEGYAKNAKSVSNFSDDLAFVYLTMHKSETAQECNGDMSQEGLISVSGYILDQNSNPGKGEVIFQDSDDVEIIGYTDKDGKYEVFVSQSKTYDIIYSTNCMSDLLERISGFEPEEIITDLTPVGNFRFSEWNRFNESATLPPYIITSSLQEFTISGSAITCNGNPISEGRVLFEEFWEIPIVDGQIELTTFDCFKIKDEYTFVIEDFINKMTSTVTTAPSNSNILDLGTIQTCEDMITTAELTIDQDNITFTNAYLTSNLERGFESQSTFIRSPIIAFENDGLRYEIISNAQQEGLYDAWIYKYLEEKPQENVAGFSIYLSSNTPALHFVEFEFTEFYGASRGTINGEFQNNSTQETQQITGSFTLRRHQEFGEY